MHLFCIWILLSAFSHEAEAATKVRRVAVQVDQIVTVQTAVGIATIIQVPDRPNSLVVGDTEAYKVEYLDQAITIKPLHGGARSNLYIYTDYRRFNVQLIAGSEASADYVVYLDIPKDKPKENKASLTWTKFQGSLTNESLSLDVKKIGRTKDNILIIEFIFKGKKWEKIDPGWLWVTQNGSMMPIHRLVLSKLEVSATSSIDGMIQILKSDIKADVPLRLELRRKRTSYLSLPEVKSWN